MSFHSKVRNFFKYYEIAIDKDIRMYNSQSGILDAGIKLRLNQNTMNHYQHSETETRLRIQQS